MRLGNCSRVTLQREGPSLRGLSLLVGSRGRGVHLYLKAAPATWVKGLPWRATGPASLLRLPPASL